MKIRKAPGPNGYSVKFYKVLKEDLIPHLKWLCQDVMDRGEIPQSWTEASIVLIPKEGQDPAQVKNYSPISLFNIDYKIFTRIVAERLKLFMQDYILKDQTGFLPSRHIKYNTRKVLDLIEYYDKQPSKKAGLFFEDTKKTLDNLKWDFLLELLQEMNFGDKFHFFFIHFQWFLIYFSKNNIPQHLGYEFNVDFP